MSRRPLRRRSAIALACPLLALAIGLPAARAAVPGPESFDRIGAADRPHGRAGSYGERPRDARFGEDEPVRGHVAIEALALGLDGGIDELPDGDGPVGGRLRIGAALTPLFGLSGHLGVARDGGGTDELDLSLLAGYLELSLPLGPVRLTGAAGVASVGLERAAREGRVGVRATTDRVSLSYGASLDVDIAPRIALTAGWTRYLDEGDEDEPALDALAFGVRLEMR